MHGIPCVFNRIILIRSGDYSRFARAVEGIVFHVQRTGTAADEELDAPGGFFLARFFFLPGKPEGRIHKPGFRFVGFRNFQDGILMFKVKRLGSGSEEQPVSGVFRFDRISGFAAEVHIRNGIGEIIPVFHRRGSLTVAVGEPRSCAGNIQRTGPGSGGEFDGSGGGRVRTRIINPVQSRFQADEARISDGSIGNHQVCRDGLEQDLGTDGGFKEAITAVFHLNTVCGLVIQQHAGDRIDGAILAD